VQLLNNLNQAISASGFHFCSTETKLTVNKLQENTIKTIETKIVVCRFSNKETGIGNTQTFSRFNSNVSLVVTVLPDGTKSAVAV